ncbi:MAG: DUF192 domain-containing protein [Alphaproteobacteria bacterium]|nr:MAG: DUF192 domain-containing protein [Alphaproteobacteria bacterium]
MIPRAALVVLALIWALPAAAACREDAIDLRGPFGQVRFHVELADEPAERARGLMFRESLPRFAGMLFVSERPERVSFWMKNTLIPLDMIFIDDRGRVVHVHERARPGDLTPISAPVPVLAVLEINGGLAAELGIAPGAEARHPVFAGAGALWPCG